MENKSTEVKMGKMPSKREARKSAHEEQRSSSYDLTEPLAMRNTAGAHSTDRMPSREYTTKEKWSQPKNQIQACSHKTLREKNR